ncbi:MAG: ABC transporter permease, partial [Firmicutes bacterium]|nr:ABC transporter permease [Bacillota bacterium]
MWPFVRLAAKNLLRHKRRNLLTGVMILIGTASIVVGGAIGQASGKGLAEAARGSLAGDIQAIAPSEKKIDLLYGSTAGTLARAGEIQAVLGRDGQVAAATQRYRFWGLLSTGERSRNVMVIAVDPALDRKVFPRLKVVKGSYFAGPDAILMCKNVARQLGVEIGDELVLLTQTPDGYLNAVTLRCQGILEAEGLQMFLNYVVYMDIATARRLLYLSPEAASEVILRLRDGADAGRALGGLRARAEAAGLAVRLEPWQNLAGIIHGIVLVNEFLPQVALFILLLTIALGIVNTVLMSVLERTREIGTMMALGTKRREVLAVTLMEMGVLSLAAAMLGALFGGAIV